MRCLGQMLDQLSMLHTKRVCVRVCVSIRAPVYPVAQKPSASESKWTCRVAFSPGLGASDKK